MQVTTYGYRIPDAGDAAKGTGGWFEAYVFNITREDGHNHDGTNSSLLFLSSLSPYTDTIDAADWVLDGAGPGYIQLITVPAAITEINNYNVKFVFTAPVGKVGQVAYIAYSRVSATTFNVYCNDNTAAFTILYR